MSNYKHNSLTPLRRVVNAAMIDEREDKGRVEHLYSHWAVRGLKELMTHHLKGTIKRIILHVSKNTRTATLPPDCDEVHFVGVIDDAGRKIELAKSSMLALNMGEIEIEEEPACAVCKQKLSICEDMEDEVVATTVTFDGVDYEEVHIRKFEPNGDYYLIKQIPYYNTETSAVEVMQTKQYIVNIERDECGCIKDIPENVFKLRAHCPSVYSCYYTECRPCDKSYGTYNIFEDEGFLQFSKAYRFDKVYIEYTGFLKKIGGQYQVPKVAFEALVAWTKWKSVEGRKSMSRFEKNDYFNHYVIAKRNMARVLARDGMSLSDVYQIAISNPKFD